jgi:hypothetical protein
MTDQEINIAIAEACGKRVELWTEPSGTSYPVIEDKNSELIFAIPDYCNDLNAMATAEIALDKHDETCPYSELWEPVYGRWLIQLTGRSNPYHATARQRAEAFLKTIGKWV